MNTETSPAPSADVRDALHRGWRTLIQGLGIDVLIAVALVLSTVSTTDIQWTSTYWVALGLAVGRSVVGAAVSYVSRLAFPPATAAHQEGGA